MDKSWLLGVSSADGSAAPVRYLRKATWSR